VFAKDFFNVRRTQPVQNVTDRRMSEVDPGFRTKG
jgi:hypothetical protein